MERRASDPLEYELQEARAIALGDVGRKLENVLTALAAAPDSEPLLDAAANAVWEWMIVRESLAFYDHAIAIGAYDVPSRVMARVGVVRKKPA